MASISVLDGTDFLKGYFYEPVEEHTEDTAPAEIYEEKIDRRSHGMTLIRP